MRKQFMKAAFALSLLFSTSCATVPQKLDADVFYKRDMKITVNGISGDGVLVAEKSDKYDIEIEAQGNLDLFTYSSCHREKTQADAGESGIFGNKRKIKFTYHPVNGLENVSYCPLEFGGYEQGLGRHSWAFLDFHTDGWIPAKLKCNGNGKDVVGVGVCQSKETLIEQIIFSAPVVVAKQPDPKCPGMESHDGLTFEYRMPKGSCVYAFKDQAGSLFRLTTLGYEKILIRNN